MKNVFCLLNHELTEKQIKELKEKYMVNNIIYPEKELSLKWSQVPSTEFLDKKLMGIIESWLSKANEDDIFIVQGDFGATFYLVDYALKRKLVPVYAVTKRVSIERRDGEQIFKQNIFEHCCFRKYEYYT